MRKSLLARAMHGAITRWFAKQGWNVIGTKPEERKFVLIAAPHTSNWDFPHFIGAMHELGITASFMGKKQLFRWPFERMMQDLGGIPVDRASSQNYVEQMIAEFSRRTDFILTIAPEGTRGKVRQWKSGFYHIAIGAKVPLVLGMMDYAKKVVGLGPTIWPTGDFDADMIKIREFYSRCTPKFPDRGNLGIADEAS